jgi:hypothetical protein
MSDGCIAQPIARSYHGYEWEGLPPHPVQPICDHTSCSIDVRGAGAGDSGGYWVEATVQSAEQIPTEAENAARLLLQGTFGLHDLMHDHV